MLKKIMLLLAPSEPKQQPDRIPLAAAVLLLEIAYSDGEFSAAEETMISQLLQENFELESDTREELMQMAAEAQRKSVDLHQFTSQINRNFNQKEKEQIIESFWQLAFADGQLEAHEETMLRQLSSLIGISHRQLIDAKIRVRDKQATPQ